jgi:hypothetical protein
MLLPLRHSCSKVQLGSETEAEETDGRASREEKRSLVLTRLSVSYFTPTDCYRLALGATRNYLYPRSVKFHCREIEGYVWTGTGGSVICAQHMFHALYDLGTNRSLGLDKVFSFALPLSTNSRPAWNTNLLTKRLNPNSFPSILQPQHVYPGV